MFEVVVGSDFFFESAADSFTCTLYCRTQDGAFPDREWTDFAQTVLSWWSSAVVEAAHARQTGFRLLFEDGPFWIEAAKQEDEVTLRFRTDRRGVQTIPDVRIPFRELTEAVERAMRRLSSGLYLTGKIALSREMAEQATQLRKRVPQRRRDENQSGRLIPLWHSRPKR